MERKNKGKSIVILLVIIALIVGGYFVLRPWLKNLLCNWAREKVITYVADNSDYKLTIDSLSFEGFAKIELHKVKLENKLSKKEFNSKNKYQTDWIRFETDQIFFKDVKWKNWFKDKGVRMEEMLLVNPKVYAYRDKRKPREPYNVKPLPTYFLRKSKQSVTVPVIKVLNGAVEYDEVVSAGTGKVNFTRVEAVLDNFSTDSVYIKDNPELKMKVNALFMDSVEMNVLYKAQINNKEDKFTLEGTIDRFQASMMNQFLEPLAKLKVESGVIRNLKFQFSADKDKAIGTLDMKYENLKTAVMKKDDPKEKSKIKTFLANVFIKDENKKEASKDEYRKGEINYERKKNFSIFNYWLNAVKSGVFDIVTDLDVEKIKEIKNKARKH